MTGALRATRRLGSSLTGVFARSCGLWPLPSFLPSFLLLAVGRPLCSPYLRTPQPGNEKRPPPPASLRLLPSHSRASSGWGRRRKEGRPPLALHSPAGAAVTAEPGEKIPSRGGSSLGGEVGAPQCLPCSSKTSSSPSVFSNAPTALHTGERPYVCLLRSKPHFVKWVYSRKYLTRLS